MDAGSGEDLGGEPREVAGVLDPVPVPDPVFLSSGGLDGDNAVN